jgi:hypothetical protein
MTLLVRNLRQRWRKKAKDEEEFGQIERRAMQVSGDVTSFSDIEAARPQD